jgi:hypothetical protein
MRGIRHVRDRCGAGHRRAQFALESAGQNATALFRCISEKFGEQPDCFEFQLTLKPLHPRASGTNVIVHIFWCR